MAGTRLHKAGHDDGNDTRRPILQPETLPGQLCDEGGLGAPDGEGGCGAPIRNIAHFVLHTLRVSLAAACAGRTPHYNH
jgi:hypothetical protein